MQDLNLKDRSTWSTPLEWHICSRKSASSSAGNCRAGGVGQRGVWPKIPPHPGRGRDCEAWVRWCWALRNKWPVSAVRASSTLLSGVSVPPPPSSNTYHLTFSPWDCCFKVALVLSPGGEFRIFDPPTYRLSTTYLHNSVPNVVSKLNNPPTHSPHHKCTQVSPALNHSDPGF